MARELALHATDTPPEGWDTWLVGQKTPSSFLHSSTWGALDSGINKAQVTYLSVEREEKRVAGALVSVVKPEISPTAPQVSGRVSCYAPVVVGPGEDRAAAVAVILDRVNGIAKSAGLRLLEFKGVFDTSPGHDAEAAVFADNGFAATPWMTNLVDLTQNEADLFMSFRQAARKGIKKCQRGAVSVRFLRTEAEIFDGFYKPYIEASRNGEIADPEIIRKNFACDRNKAYMYAVAEDRDGHPLSVLGTYRFAGEATEVSSAVTAMEHESKLPAQDLLHWEFMLHHKRLGDAKFNMAGFNPTPENSKELGIRRFKEKWGGQIVTFNGYTLRRPSPRSFRATVVSKIRKALA